MQQLRNSGRSKGERCALPHVDDREIIRDRPASRCHAVSAVFGAAQTERCDAQRTFRDFPRLQEEFLPTKAHGNCNLVHAAGESSARVNSKAVTGTQFWV